MAVAKIIELTSRSDQSFEDAVEHGLQKATDSVNNVQSAWVKDQQVLVENGKISTYQVTLKVTFVVQ
jgi:flavin-binding protein dodecin